MHPHLIAQPDRPAGRGMRLQASPVKQLAQGLGLPVIQPRSLRLDGKAPDDAEAARAALLDAAPDVMVVAAYGLLLPQWVLELPRLGCLNIHGSLLPRWRGAAPVQRATAAGPAPQGNARMQRDAGRGAGAMLLQAPEPILADDTSASLLERLAQRGAELAVAGLRRLADGGSLPARPQPEAGATYARKIDKAEAQIDWTAPAALIERRARAFDPFPGLHFVHEGETIKLWRARVVPGQGAPGEVLPSGPGRCIVACGDGVLELLVLQRPGQRRAEAAAWLQAHPLMPGQRLHG